MADMSKKKKRRSGAKKMPAAQPCPLWMLLVQQLLLTGLVLCIFATFHHVLPHYLRRAPAAAVTPPPPIVTTSPDALPPADAAPSPKPEAEEETEAAPAFNPFTEEVIRTDRSYTGPTLAITITEYDHPEAHPKMSYYVADVYVKSVEQLSSATPAGRAVYQDPLQLAWENSAILAINGDNAVGSVFSVRNGVLKKNAPNVPGDICVIYRDGSLEILPEKGYDPEQVLSADPWQVLCFGPGLLDADGHAVEEFNLDHSLQVRHPRTVLGYYAPCHYCLVVIDGRDLDHSLGASIQETAQVMEELGCRSAYNLDGGASSAMIWQDKRLNKPRQDRLVADMLVLRELEEEAAP